MNKPVLVLNANFEPLNVCTTRRAMGLLMMDKAIMVSNGRGVIHTPSRTFLRPSVIRLGYMIKRPRPKVSLNRHEILRRDDYTCQYCGQKGGPLTIDHVIPRRKGGRHTWTNLVAACQDCNRIKGGLSPVEAHMSLIRQPFEPRATAEYLYGRYLKNNQDWVFYIER
jgi:5-methylcytosine-specific restriction endonuclease McrA